MVKVRIGQHYMQNETITRLILKHRATLFGFLLAQVSDPNEAEDLFQEACVTIINKFDSFEEGTNFKAWALTICRYKVMSYYKTHRQQAEVVSLSPELVEQLSEHPVLTEEDNTADERAALHKCMRELKGKNRELILQRYGKGKSCSDIAAAISWKVNAVYVALTRIRKSLKHCVTLRLKQASHGH